MTMMNKDNSYDKINSYDRILKHKVRYASFLFLLCLLFIISIIGLNTTIETNIKKYETLQNSYKNASNYLAKYRCYKLKNSNFYRNLIVASITSGKFSIMDSTLFLDWRFSNFDVWFDLTDGEIHSWRARSSSYSALFDSIFSPSKEFGIQCEKLFFEENDTILRLRELNRITDSIFTNEKINSYLHKYILRDLNNINDPKNWPQIIRWIVLGEWPYFSDGGFSLDSGISYTNRFKRNEDYNEVNYHLCETLSITDSNLVETLLRTEWENTYLEYENYSIDTPKMNFANIGISIGIDDILLVVGPLLFFFQALFMLYWNKEKQFLLNKGYQQEFIFPDFNVSGSPFPTTNARKSFQYYFTNINWTLFLILPSLILLFGFLTRYDIASLKNYHIDTSSSLRRLLSSRANDIPSIFIDLINLVCLSLNILIVLLITKQDIYENKIKIPFEKKTTITALLFIAISLVIYFILNSTHIFDKEVVVFYQSPERTITYFLFVVQLLIWIYFAVLSIINKSIFVFRICIGAIIFNLSLWF